MIFLALGKFRKNENFRKKSENIEKIEFYGRERQEVYGMERHSTSPPCGNLVDGLPHDCHTETIAKLARLGPAKNGATLENFIELTMFCSMIDMKTHRISCPECFEDLDRCIKT